VLPWIAATRPRLLAITLVLAGVLAGCSAVNRPQVSPSSAAAVPTTGDPAAAAAALVARLGDEDLVGQVLMPAINLNDPAGGSVELVRSYHLGGVILMGSVAASEDPAVTVRALTGQLQSAARALPAGVGLLIGTDQEYGFVTRMRSGVVQLPSAMAFGAAARPELTQTAWHGAATELAAIGINVDFAPDADVIGGAANTVIGSRSYGSDATAVSEQVAAAVRGLQAAGVAATVKHFPGHGHTAVDSHEALPVLAQSRQSLNAADLPPFRAGIDAGAMLVMAGHLDVRAIDPGVTATFSHKVLVDLLRGELGFAGVTVSDAMNMAPAMQFPTGEATVRALLAGIDLVLMPPDVKAARQGLLDALHGGQLPRPRLVEAATRVLTLKFRLAAFPATEVSTANKGANATAAAEVAAAAVTVLRGPCTGPLVKGALRVSASGGREQQRGWLTDALRANGLQVVDQGGSVVHLVGYGDAAADLATGVAVTVAMDSPYVLQSATSPVRVATYSATRAAMEALAAVIAGKAPAPGRSPVPVPGLPRSACSS
jgi:beta-N-acetylhexosaminidase